MTSVRSLLVTTIITSNVLCTRSYDSITVLSFFHELQVGKLNEIVSCGESVELLERCGILLDSEADCLTEEQNDSDSHDMSRSALHTILRV